jgi:hypothetical protein
MNKRVFMVVIVMVGVLVVGWHPSSLSLAKETYREGPSPLPSKSSQTKEEVEEFVSRVFVDGLPFTEMKKRGDSKTVKALSELLDEKCGANGEGHPFCSNIVAWLGVIGGVEAGESLQRFLRKKDVSDFKAKTDASMALGYWIHESKGAVDDSDLFSTVINCLMAQSERLLREEEERTVKANPCADAADDAQQRRLGIAATIGLGLSGDPRVEGTLQTLLKDAAVGSSYRAMIITALEAHNRIAAHGLVCYYERGSRACRESVKQRANIR